MNHTSTPSWNDFPDGPPSISTDSERSTSRAASPEKGHLTYSDALTKGTILLEMMQADDYTAGQMFTAARPSAESQFLSPTALQTWGYNRSTPNFDELENIISPLYHIGVDTDNIQGSGLNVEIFDHHIHATTHDGMLFPSTGAKFCTLVSHEHGLLVATQSYGPEFKTKHQEENPILPDLQHWSDMAYLQCHENVADLKYVLRYRIQNNDTQAIIRHLCGETGPGDGLLWPGVTFRMDEDSGKALLGTPHGSGIAWLLIQHKKQLGHKTLDKVTLYFKNEEDARMRDDPCLLFYLKDVPT
ncbi:hypothetical protein P153DRAFT_112702 [Dothidotthia symphoricarpi CBS 119687]|uniref:Uncharacterized protein n=1 Tax=Dothidotthia symphoricarpi CBS 119687 TaxID=1392245 RepID=A0A6A6A2K3_9PLEO|nr:uncharacterized protein P153DRAFT_112702 [Dothidotthia symphoricarpi CBS 119687]KAF2125413.1 hypothetical protein P153DRAFT_112702 [Dothidotthia symphoricarpi CBS 119687]